MSNLSKKLSIGLLPYPFDFSGEDSRSLFNYTGLWMLEYCWRFLFLSACTFLETRSEAMLYSCWGVNRRWDYEFITLRADCFGYHYLRFNDEVRNVDSSTVTITADSLSIIAIKRQTCYLFTSQCWFENRSEAPDCYLWVRANSRLRTVANVHRLGTRSHPLSESSKLNLFSVSSLSPILSILRRTNAMRSGFLQRGTELGTNERLARRRK